MRMRKAGFETVKLSPGHIVNGQREPSTDDKQRAIEMNAAWDRHRLGLEPSTRSGNLPGSIGEGYHRAVLMRQAERQAKGITWTAEQHSRDDWPRAWKWLGPVFVDIDPRTVTPEMLLALRTTIAAQVSESEAHRVIKVWRALWKRMALLGFCQMERDPSLFFANSAPRPRQTSWTEGEAVRLVKQAWRSGYHGLAAALGVAWDTQFSPDDCRRLTASQLHRDRIGAYFKVDRAKTGRAAIGTLTRRAERVLGEYLSQLAAEPVGTAPIFRNRSGQPYTKDTLGDDFRVVRTMLFGESETRQLADFRRSGSIEAMAGDVSPQKLSSKMANTLSASNRLHQTYVPVKLVEVRVADAARKRGQRLLREQKTDESVREPDQKCLPNVQQKPKSLK